METTGMKEREREREIVLLFFVDNPHCLKIARSVVIERKK